MRTVEQIEKETDYLGFHIDHADGEDSDYLGDMTADEIVALAKELKVSPRLLKAFQEFSEAIQRTVGADLEAIWKRLDKMENV